jgi:hypothetical protein
MVLISPFGLRVAQPKWRKIVRAWNNFRTGRGAKILHSAGNAETESHLEYSASQS